MSFYVAYWAIFISHRLLFGKYFIESDLFLGN